MRIHNRKAFVVRHSGIERRINSRHFQYALRNKGIEFPESYTKFLEEYSVNFTSKDTRESIIQFVKQNIRIPELTDYFQQKRQPIEVATWLKEGSSSELEVTLEDEGVPDKIYKYRPINLNTLRILFHNQLYFSDPINFNDPFECSISGSGSEIMESLEKRFPTCCFSTIKDNILMYSHYADSHGGVVLEFNAQNPYEVIDEKGFGYEPFAYPVMYFETMPKYEPEHDADILTSKSHIWNYEDEVRVMIVQNGAKPGNYRFNPKILTGIYFGYRCSDSDKVMLSEIAKAKYPEAKIFFTEKSRGEYKIKSW